MNRDVKVHFSPKNITLVYEHLNAIVYLIPFQYPQKHADMPHRVFKYSFGILKNL